MMCIVYTLPDFWSTPIITLPYVHLIWGLATYILCFTRWYWPVGIRTFWFFLWEESMLQPIQSYIEWLWTNKWSTVQMNASDISYLFPKHQAYWRRKRKQTREMRETREIGACRQHWRLNICRYIGWVDKYSIRSQDPNNSSDRSFTRETWLTLKLDWH